MIISCKESDKDKIYEYIGRDYGKCLYIFIDLKKYPLDGDVFKAWIQYRDDDICAVITEYYGGFQIYSKDLDLDAREAAEFFKENGADKIFGAEELIDKLKAYFPDFEQELGIVGQLGTLTDEYYEDAYSAPLEELPEIVSIVAEDEGIGKPYGYDSLFTQFSERKQNDFGRNYILRDPENDNRIICHAGTYAELPELAVIGGVISAPEYRGKGYSKGTLAALCKELRDEGKDVFSFFYIPSATRMHYGVGFEKVCNWAKIMK